jgi:hypothetical protein
MITPSTLVSSGLSMLHEGSPLVPPVVSLKQGTWAAPVWLHVRKA